jgi:hypothetical protein
MLTGTDKIIFANKKNPNTASILYCKSSFSNILPQVSCNQKCSAPNCKSCNVMALPKQFAYNDLKIKLDFSLNLIARVITLSTWRDVIFVISMASLNFTLARLEPFSCTSQWPPGLFRIR